MKIIVVGGGFAGLEVVKGLNQELSEVLLIDQSNHHLFQPLLYQVATAALAPSDIASPLREIFKKQKNCTVLMAKVVRIDRQKKCVVLDDGSERSYDKLILAVGGLHSYFGNDQWEAYAPGIKSLADATNLREKILTAFERAEKCATLGEAQKHLRFVIIGGGPTGVELAGALGEISRKTLMKDFRKIHTEQTEIILIEGGEHILAAFPRKLSVKARKTLEKLGVSVWTHTHVTEVNEDGVRAGETFLECTNVIWAAGVKAAPLLGTLGVDLDRAGRAPINNDLTLKGDDNIYILGDASIMDKPLPGIAPVAIQQGRHVARQLRKKQSLPFNYFDKGTLATVGKMSAVGQLGKWSFSGFSAWCVWSIIHIAYLVNYRNRFSVFIDWAWLYLTGRRTDRLIIRSNKN